jgi:hypothetical protein
MKPTEKIKSDQQRAVKAVDQALASVAIERSEGSSSSLFPTLDSKVAYVQALYAHKPREDEHGMLPATRTLTERVKMKKDEQYQRKLTGLQVQRQMLEASRMQIQKESEGVHEQVRKERGPKTMTLKEALANDARLEAMPATEVLKEFVGEEVRTNRANSFVRRPVEVIKVAARDEEEEEDEDEDTSDEEESSGDEDEDEDEESEDSQEDEESEVISPAMGPTPSKKGPNHQVKPTAKKKSKADEDFMRAVEQETGIGMKKAKAPPAPSPQGDLKKVVKAIAGDISSQEHNLKELKMKQALTLTKLQWMKRRPVTYERGSLFPSTSKGKAMKDLCDHLVEEIVNKAWHKISMRPDPKEVAREVQEFKAKHMSVLLGIGRHFADAIVKDVVDELIVEIASETNGLQKAADQFAFNLLVEAVALSQPDQKHGFHFRGEDVHLRMKEVSKAQEMLLRDKIEESRALGHNRGKMGALSQKMESRVRFTSEDKDLLDESAREGGGLWGEGSDPFGKLDARNWERMPDRPKLKIDSAKVAGGDKLSEESDIYALQRALDNGVSLSEKVSVAEII